MSPFITIAPSFSHVVSGKFGYAASIAAVSAAAVVYLGSS